MVCLVVLDRGLWTSADSTDCLCISGFVRLLLHGDPLASADCFPFPWQSPPERIFGGTSNLALKRGLMFLNADGLFKCVIGSSVEVGQFSAGFLLHYLRWHRYILMFVCCLLTASAGGMAAVGPGDKNLGVALMFLAVFSVGVIECIAVVNCPVTCPPEHLGSALGALGSIRSTSAAIASKSMPPIKTGLRLKGTDGD